MVCLIRRLSEKLTACLTPTSEMSMSLLARCLLQRALCELIGSRPVQWWADDLGKGAAEMTGRE
jgi:hypothetical protein